MALQSRRQPQLQQRLNDASNESGEAGWVIVEDPPPPPPQAANNSQQRFPRQRTRGTTRPTKAQIYHRVLVKFMRYQDGVEYEFSHHFTQDKLREITPDDILRYFKFETYNNPNANPYVDKPLRRSNCLKLWKKAISYYMPNPHMQYNEIANVGNPMRSPMIEDLINQVVRKETTRRGSPSQRRHTLFPVEFEQAMEHLSVN